MGFFRDLLEDFKTDKNRLSIGISFSSMVISFVVALVVIAGFVWGIWWARAQEKKADDRAAVQATNDDARTKSFENQVDRLQDIHKVSIEKLGKEYAKVVSAERSDLETEMRSFVERSDETVLDETVRRIVASHGNIERARKDIYEKAVDEGLEGRYIFQLNQVPAGFGSGVFRTHHLCLLGSPEDEGSGSSFLLTKEEKESINSYVDSYLEKEENEKGKGGFADKSTQKEIFFVLLAQSSIGRITESPELLMPNWNSPGEIEVLSPYAKLGAVIGHIGDKMRSYE